MSSDPKANLYRELARVGTALSNGSRLVLLELLAQAERSVETLAEMADLSVANCSKHLQVLRQAGLVTARKEGLRVYYSIAGTDVVTLYAALQSVGQTHLAEVERLVRQWLTRRDEMEPVPAAELLDRAKNGLVVVLDVRPAEEYAAGHLPGAINIPVDQLESRLGKLCRTREIVAYCRGPYCLMSFEAVEKLRKRGIKARRLENGYPEWAAAGLPVER